MVVCTIVLLSSFLPLATLGIAACELIGALLYGKMSTDFSMLIMKLHGHLGTPLEYVILLFLDFSGALVY